MAVGYFGVSFLGNLFHRNIFTTEKWAVTSQETIQEIFQIIHHAIDTFSPLIEAISEGKAVLEDVMNEM